MHRQRYGLKQMFDYYYYFLYDLKDVSSDKFSLMTVRLYGFDITATKFTHIWPPLFVRDTAGFKTLVSLTHTARFFWK